MIKLSKFEAKLLKETFKIFNNANINDIINYFQLKFFRIKII